MKHDILGYHRRRECQLAWKRKEFRSYLPVPPKFKNGRDWRSHKAQKKILRRLRRQWKEKGSADLMWLTRRNRAVMHRMALQHDSSLCTGRVVIGSHSLLTHVSLMKVPRQDFFQEYLAEPPVAIKSESNG